MSVSFACCLLFSFLVFFLCLDFETPPVDLDASFRCSAPSLVTVDGLVQVIVRHASGKAIELEFLLLDQLIVVTSFLEEHYHVSFVARTRRWILGNAASWSPRGNKVFMHLTRESAMGVFEMLDERNPEGGWIACRILPLGQHENEFLKRRKSSFLIGFFFFFFIFFFN